MGLKRVDKEEAQRRAGIIWELYHKNSGVISKSSAARAIGKSPSGTALDSITRHGVELPEFAAHKVGLVPTNFAADYRKKITIRNSEPENLGRDELIELVRSYRTRYKELKTRHLELVTQLTEG